MHVHSLKLCRIQTFLPITWCYSIFNWTDQYVLNKGDEVTLYSKRTLPNEKRATI